jgi:hypothetical protein
MNELTITVPGAGHAVHQPRPRHRPHQRHRRNPAGQPSQRHRHSPDMRAAQSTSPEAHGRIYCVSFGPRPGPSLGTELAAAARTGPDPTQPMGLHVLAPAASGTPGRARRSAYPRGPTTGSDRCRCSETIRWRPIPTAVSFARIAAASGAGPVDDGVDGVGPGVAADCGRDAAPHATRAAKATKTRRVVNIRTMDIMPAGPTAATSMSGCRTCGTSTSTASSVSRTASCWLPGPSRNRRQTVAVSTTTSYKILIYDRFH